MKPTKKPGDKYSPYVDFICRTLFSPATPSFFVWPPAIEFPVLLEVLAKNRITVRWLTKMKPFLPAAFHAKAEETLKSEQERLGRALEMTGHLYQAFKKRGLNFVVMKTLDNYPDLGHDVDIFSDAAIAKIDEILLGEFHAKLEDPSLPERIATKRNYKVHDYAMFEIHCTRLGELGEENRLGRDFPVQTREITINGVEACIPTPEFRILLVVLQRIYRHYNIRICDVYNTAQMVQSNEIDWIKLKDFAVRYGLWEGVQLYFSYVRKVTLRYGLELGLEKYLDDKDWPQEIADRNMHFRFPLISTALRVSMRKFVTELRWLNFDSAARLFMYAPLATAHFLSVKLFGRSRIW